MQQICETTMANSDFGGKTQIFRLKFEMTHVDLILQFNTQYSNFLY